MHFVVVQARQAKAKLDKILKSCGTAAAVNSNTSTKVRPGRNINESSPPSAAGTDAVVSKRGAEPIESSGEYSDKRRKHFGRDDSINGPTDCTGIDTK